MKKLLALPVAVATLALTGSLVTAPAQAATTRSTSVTSSVAAGDLSPQQSHALLEQLESKLPAGYEAKFEATKARLGLHDSDLQQTAVQAIDPTDYECPATTPVTDWVDASIADWTMDDRLNAFIILLLDPITYDALFFPEPANQRFFGLDGEYTTTIKNSFKGLQGFWDIRSDDIETVPAHGDTLLDQSRVARALTAAHGFSAADAASLAGSIATIANQPKFDFGNHPLFTFNAFAWSAEGEPIPGAGLPRDKIVMGDGVLEGFRSLGLGDVASKAILAHEFGHHIQYERKQFVSALTGAEATRRTELMADSYAAYFLSHQRGAHLRWSRVQQYLETFYDLGDCGFDAEGHHGTPNQRRRAATWGLTLATVTFVPRYVLPTVTFGKLFDKVLPQLVRPDAIS
ncbi:hypothetical protein [Kribbella sp. CA-293567]|uniref:hypothetical protein n=1 Tax=Kribbella sp. CA-293567 TaxID=3002436 RepID=UPI0022DD4775|nr:hypothetical protein [Kribbella sp. CA-293567]WBQ02496.1 hypothetical protein OX958_21180 [Kribbella sp. CA-293567]